MPIHGLKIDITLITIKVYLVLNIGFLVYEDLLLVFIFTLINYQSILLIGDGFGIKVALRPAAGLDYKINNVPLAFPFDWRPFIGLGEYLGNEVGAFGIGIRYVIE